MSAQVPGGNHTKNADARMPRQCRQRPGRPAPPRRPSRQAAAGYQRQHDEGENKSRLLRAVDGAGNVRPPGRERVVRPGHRERDHQRQSGGHGAREPITQVREPSEHASGARFNRGGNRSLRVDDLLTQEHAREQMADNGRLGHRKLRDVGQMTQHVPRPEEKRRRARLIARITVGSSRPCPSSR